jgi:RimJ/RimL family protein N-acetyltransferase
MQISTARLRLVLQSIDEVRAMVAAMGPEERAELSADWLARLHASTESDPWSHGFSIVERDSNTMIGKAGYKAPPDADGMVEIAYGIAPEHQGVGYATEAAAAMTSYAFGTGNVQLVRAHTRPRVNASTRVLEKCGFHRVDDVIDPEDGLVWRYEQSRDEFTRAQRG